MQNDLETTLQLVQVEADRAAMERYGPEIIARWQNGWRRGRPDGSNASGRAKGVCGDSVEIHLRIVDHRIVDAGYLSTGCGASQACASMCCDLAFGRKLDETGSITALDVLEGLGGLPEDDEHCALLAVNALREALPQDF